MKYEVRCCCVPKKLLGYLHAPANVREWAWIVKQPMSRIAATEQETALTIRRIVLPIALFSTPERSYYAIKAEGLEIDTLRKIVGFEEA